ncbi:MAG: threonine synthase [Bacteroides sp.]|nr:threonine synthase [Bacillota bacterium]MCM1393349.1 threonine synthase [[Eubacterium] siraeum]MCM1454903.1 threonine synthase [Bacteroides sp.]
MKYTSTRNALEAVFASEAIVKGISDDGGLFVPSSFPHLDAATLDSLLKMDYQERVAKILSLHFDEFDFEELLDIANNAYSRFDDSDPCPVVKIEDGLYMLELWHGPTCSEKDMASALLARLIGCAKRRLGREEKTLALIATSGDTGALDAFNNAENIEVVALYPVNGVSPVQRMQLTACAGGNLHIAGVNGGFDDVQAAARKALNDREINTRLENCGYKICAADNLNIASIVAKIAYFVSAYCDLVNGGEIELGERIDFAIPTGDFSEAIAGYYAYKMGLPVNKFILASDENNALTDFFNTGVYDVDRKRFKTSSPSMDVLFASNIERLIFEVCGRDGSLVCELFDRLAAEKKFEFDPDVLRDRIFEAGWADEDDVKEAIFTFFDLDDYVMDTHTAVGASVYNDYSCETEDETATVILSVSSPFKHALSVLSALGTRENDPFKAIAKLQIFTALDCPECLMGLQYRDEIHTTVIDAGLVGDAILNFIKK